MDQSGEASPHAIVQIVLPAAILRPLVTFYYFVEVFGPLTDFLYPEWGNVRFVLSGEWQVRNDPRDAELRDSNLLFGPTDRCGQILTEGGATAGFGLTPLGWERLVGCDAGPMANRVRALGDELGADSAELNAALVSYTGDLSRSASLFDEVLTSLARERPPNSPGMLCLDTALRSLPNNVAELSDLVGMSQRTLYRACLRGYGFAPKRLLRRQRFLDTLGVMRGNPQTTVHGLIGRDYFDHSHFNRDFRDFMGMTARSYANKPRALMKAAAAAQAANGIPLSFELPEAPSTAG